MNLKLVGKTVIGGRQFNMSDSDGTVQKTRYGLTDDFYGGMLKEFRKVKNSGLLLCLDKRDNIINLAYVESELTDNDRELLGLSKPLIHIQVEGLREAVYSEPQNSESFAVDNTEEPLEDEVKEIATSITKRRR
jgi:hypothetical protein